MESSKTDCGKIGQDRTELARLARNLTWLILDVDGVLTDGGVFLVGENEEAKRFDIQDGMGITLARAAGLKIGIITGRQSVVVERRASELKIDEVLQGYHCKEAALDLMVEKYNLLPAQIAYVGDDIQDLPVLERVGMPLAVKNARPELLNTCLYVTQASGGYGAVREIVDWLLELRGQKVAIYEQFSAGRETGQRDRIDAKE